MTQVFVDAATAELLKDTGCDVVICDPQGVPLGRFRSDEIARRYAEAATAFTDEELDQAERDRGNDLTTEELIRKLESGHV
ncbi:MAG: hypothetical protein KDA86_12905 [Planctomycetaceae bacterium]|nr:hypothetical protein [Planctomycetaceae bacterium]MCA9112663.1 hypothetical protein [Planctomycetaceae bacterium]